MGWIRPLILLCAFTGTAAAQVSTSAQRPTGITTLQLGTPIERSISPGQAHYYQVVADENSLIQLTVEQKGIDLVVRVRSPSGKQILERDSPNGDNGPEDVSFVTANKLPYQIEVAPLGREPRPPGRYEIKLIEQRQATEQEIKDNQNQDALKGRGLALLNELDGLITEVRLPQTRMKAQIQAAGLLWEADEKRASKYLTDAITTFKEVASELDVDSKDYTRKYHLIANLRYEIIQAVRVRQPEMALSFMRSNPPLPDPYGNQRDLAANEAAMEIDIANQLLEKDPKRTFELARESIKSRLTSNLINTVDTLSRTNPDMAAELAGEIASKLLSASAVKDSQTGTLLISLVRLSATPVGNQGGDTNGSSGRRLLSEQQRRDLLQKAVRDVVDYRPPPINVYRPDRDYIWRLATELQQMAADVDSVMNGGAAAVEKKLKELNTNGNDPRMEEIQKFQTALNNEATPIEELIQTLSKAPADQRDQLFINLANRAQNSGDLAKAKQILNDYVKAPYQRQQALYNLEMQEMYRGMQKGKIDDALRNIANFSTPQERAQALSQMASQIGPGYKRAAAIALLDQARGLLPSSVQAQSQAEMQALFEIAKAYSRYDGKRAFEIVDPLVDQFNEISAAARTLEGFAGEFYEQEELNMQNGNAVTGIAMQLSSTLGTLGLTNFDLSKATADRIRLPEVRLRAYLEIAQQAIQNTR